ncbi:MAG TPA: hypothetical protein ENK31_05370, partial [Nannocystis exedens]|nr:hypothetical protein [Nannocystis exedens]
MSTITRPLRIRPIHFSLAGALAGAILFLASGSAGADEAIKLRDTFSGNIDFLITGATMAADTDNNNKVDAPAQPATATIIDAPMDATLLSAKLYWAGTIEPSMCENEAKLDKEVDFTAPGQDLEAVIADGCYCSIGAMTYDMQLCFADVTELIDNIKGEYSVDGLDALLDNGDTHNASFALVMIYESENASPRRVGIYDGLTTMVKSMNPKVTVSLENIEVDKPPQGELAWYALEGDINGNKDEFVEVVGQPGGKKHTLSDEINPPNNPFNQTINTANP